MKWNIKCYYNLNLLKYSNIICHTSIILRLLQDGKLSTVKDLKILERKRSLLKDIKIEMVFIIKSMEKNLYN